MSSDISLRPFDVVYLRGVGATPTPVLVGIDSGFVILSTRHMLSPVLAIPELIDRVAGNMIDLIASNPKLYEKILHQVIVLNTQKPERYLTNDALMIIRAFILLCVHSDIGSISSKDITSSLDQAIEQDEMLRRIHHNIAESYMEARGHVD